MFLKNPTSKLPQTSSCESLKQIPLTLTNREKEMFVLLLEGYSMREIAERLHIGGQTVRNYASQIYEKLEVSSKTELIIKYRK